MPPKPAGFDVAFRKVRELVADFRPNEELYLIAACQEPEARRDFIDQDADARLRYSWLLN